MADFLNDNYYHKLKLPPPRPKIKEPSPFALLRNWVRDEITNNNETKAIKIHNAMMKMIDRQEAYYD